MSAEPGLQEKLWRQVGHPFHRRTYDGRIEQEELAELLDPPFREGSVNGEIRRREYSEGVPFRRKSLEEWTEIVENLSEPELYGQKYEGLGLATSSFWRVDAVSADDIEVHFQYKSV